MIDKFYFCTTGPTRILSAGFVFVSTARMLVSCLKSLKEFFEKAKGEKDKIRITTEEKTINNVPSATSSI